jgi:hypothetical protein
MINECFPKLEFVLIFPLFCTYMQQGFGAQSPFLLQLQMYLYASNSYATYHLNPC